MSYGDNQERATVAKQDSSSTRLLLSWQIMRELGEVRVIGL